MDTLTLMVSIILMMMFLQFDQAWLIFGTVILVILSTRSLSTAFLMILALGAIYFTQDFAKAYWPLLIFGLVILSLVMEFRQKPQQPEYYAPDLGGGMGGDMGGMMGGGMGGPM